MARSRSTTCTRLLLATLIMIALSACASLGPTVVIGEQPADLQPTRALSQEPLRQSAIIPQAGIRAMDVVLVVPQNAPELASRSVQLQVTDGSNQLLQSETVETATYAHNSPLTVHFPPQPKDTLVELRVTADPAAQIALWASAGDSYPDGRLSQTDNDLSNTDLFFTFRQQATLDTLWQKLQRAAERWRGIALWLPLLLVTPGWLLIWLVDPGGERPVTPMVTALSLAMAPFSYLLLGLTPLHLFEPLIHSAFQATALLLALLMLRNLPRVREALRTRWSDALWLLLIAIVLAIASWLIVSADLPPIPPDEAIRSLAADLVNQGQLSSITAPLPPATMGATVAQMTRQPVDEMLFLVALMLGVAVLPGLFGLAAEIGEEPPAALWVLPLMWLWPPLWGALDTLDTTQLYGFALLPVVIAMGLRALRNTDHPWRNLLLAALPLTALSLVQGVGALIAWLLTLWLALLWRRPNDPELPVPLAPEIMLRSIGWLLLALFLYFPAWWFGENPMTRVDLMLPAYALVILSVALALVGGLMARQNRRATWIIGLVAVLLCLGLTLWRGSPEGTYPLLYTLDQWAR